jgi:hypothetical protein
MSRAIMFFLALYGMMVLCESVFSSTSSDCDTNTYNLMREEQQ